MKTIFPIIILDIKARQEQGERLQEGEELSDRSIEQD
jgi:hypothetical protein